MIQEEEQKQPDSIFGTEPLNEIDKALLEIARWTRLISVIGFGIGASIVLVMLFSGAQILSGIAETLLPGGSNYFYPVLVAAFFILFFMAAMVLFYLHKASRALVLGVLQKDATQLAEAFLYLRNFFIVVIIFAAFQLAGNLFNLL
ncbi:hypothetical protein ABDK00_001020 [Niabella insulamsoli]|uniref:hypothetical protein n=1 Tax=Niabella insulamsoli TaxID=3144874 RepID=UPI0031FE0734